MTSSSDPASSNIRAALLDQFPFEASGIQHEGTEIYAHGEIGLVTLSSPLPLVYDTDLDFDVEAYVFASRHVSEKDVPAFTVHFPGNFGNVTYGGRANELAYTHPSLQRSYFLHLWDRRGNLPGYDITLEATHHGPTNLARPVIFVELGSAPEQWSDRHAAKIIAKCLMNTLTGPLPKSKVACALGGTHYSHKFRSMIVDEDYALAAICSKHNLPYLTDDLLSQMINKSVEPVDHVLVDWKGLGREKDRIMKLLEKVDIEVARV